MSPHAKSAAVCISRDHLDANTTQQFDYSAVGALKDAQSGRYGSYEFKYDPVGNRTTACWRQGSQQRNETLITNKTTSNRLMQIDTTGSAGSYSVSYGYNDAGSVVRYWLN